MATTTAGTCVTVDSTPQEAPVRDASTTPSTALRRKGSNQFMRRFSRLLSPSEFEPKEVNLLEECALIYPGRQWSDLSSGEQVEVIRAALQPQHYLIDPHCEYMKYWDLVLSVALLFTGIVTPYEVIFVGRVKWDNWLFIVNRIVDIIFCKDMIMQFFLKVETGHVGKTGTVTLKDPWAIRKRYLTRWFVIDLISIMQFDIFFMFYEGPESLSRIKFLRCLRLIRLIKLVRILKSSRLIVRWQNYFAISFATQKLAKFTFGLFLSSHWMACLWGMVGISIGYELCEKDGTLIAYDEEPTAQISWVTTLYNHDNGGTLSPDDPCDPWHVYMASLHWSVMTITSIGYGDIVPVRDAEYVTCIFCMLFGGILWAYIIGSTCSLIANADPVESNFETNTDLLNHMLTEADVPHVQRSVYRGYLREAKSRDTLVQFREVARRFSPALKGQLLMHVSRHWIGKIYYLAGAPEQCLMEIADSVDTQFYSRKEVLVGISDKLCALERGTLAKAGHILTPGSAFHLDFIVSNPKWRKREQAVSLTYTLLLVLDRDRFFEVIQPYPATRKAVSQAAVRFAMMRAVQRCAKAARPTKRAAGPRLASSIVDVFEQCEVNEGAAAFLGQASPGGGGTSRRASWGNDSLPVPMRTLSDKRWGRVSAAELPDVMAADAKGEALRKSLTEGADLVKARLSEMQRQLDRLRALRWEAALEKKDKATVEPISRDISRVPTMCSDVLTI